MSYQDQAKRYLSQLDKSTKHISILDQFEKQTNLPRSYAVLGAGALYFLLILFNFGGIGQLLSNIAGFVIPGYYSLVALKTTTSSDDTQLLTYWVVFAFINVIEFWSNTILYYVPFYYVFKTGVLIYLSVFNGATLVYNSVIRPVSDKYIHVESPISSKIQETAEGVSTAIHN
ncbi:YOP1 Protein YOP1 [Candida maltosa Xu316]|uniref:Protein YOP1 n=1 Tax=Candida maltosa (strain Xu316) TaxID=1245528 RepID=M3HG86_CANMX|nr:Protein YOP1 [Candida maltosa Xu316]